MMCVGRPCPPSSPISVASQSALRTPLFFLCVMLAVEDDPSSSFKFLFEKKTVYGIPALGLIACVKNLARQTFS